MQTSVYELTLICFGALVVLVSLRNPRGIAWVLLILADLIATTAYWKSGQPYGEVITGATDFAVAYSIYALGKYRWEMLLCWCYLGSLLCSLGYLGEHAFGITIINQDGYSAGLEIANGLAFLLIGGISAFQLFGTKNVLANPYVLRPWRRWLSPIVFPALREDRSYKSPRA